MRVSDEQYNQIFHCKCGHRPVVKKEFRSYGIVTGTKYWYFIICHHCKSKSKRFTHWKEEKAIKRATNDWNKRCGKEKFKGELYNEQTVDTRGSGLPT